MELLKLLSASQIVAQIASFLVLLFLLRIFAWKKILKLLDDRKAKIASELEEIENGKIKIQELKREYEKQLTQINELSEAKIRETIGHARVIVDEAKKKAYEDAQDIIVQARESIQYELGKAKEELKDQIVALTISATEKLVQENLNDDVNTKIVRDFINNLDNNK